jgi:hypothetical protein
MRNVKRLAMVILTMGAVPIFAQQTPWPPDITVNPANPTTDESVTLSFSDVWPDSCVPISGTISYQYNIESDDDAIYVTIRTPSYFTCNAQTTAWQGEVTVPPLNLGCYDVYVALEDSYHTDRPFTKVATFCVQEASGGSDVPWPPGVTVSPQDPTTNDPIMLSFFDVWPDSCVPSPDSISYRYNVEVDKDAIYVTIRTPSYFTCLDQTTSWRQKLEVRPLNLGCYDVHVALEDAYHADQPFTKVATFCVREGSGGPDVPWPPNVTVRPGNPAVNQSVTLTFSDTWSESCVPVPSTISHDYNIEQTDDVIRVTIRTPSYITCLDQATSWQQEITVGPLRLKCYDVYVALEDVYHADQPFTKVASFCAGDNSGGSAVPWPPALTISPQGPTVEEGEPLTLTFSGSWPDGCVPTSETVTYQYEGNAVYVKIAAPLYITCPKRETSWQQQITLKPPAPGSYDVYVELADSLHGGQPPTKVTTFQVTAVGSGTDCWPLYVLTRSGIRTVSATGAHKLLIDEHKNSRAIEIRDRMLYATADTRGADIWAYDLQGQYLKTIGPPPEAKDYLTFVALPEDRFALLDNLNDKVFIIDDGGSLLATVPIRPYPDNSAQSVDGVVVGDRLILSEDGYGHILQIDLTTYQLTIFKDLSDLPDVFLGAIAYADGTYYICTDRSLYSFTATGSPVKVAEVPEKNITGIVVFDASAYVTVNFSGRIYEVDLGSGAVRLLSGELNYPLDLECAEDTAGAEYFELCLPDSMWVPDQDTACWTFTEPVKTSLPPQPTWAPWDAVVTGIDYKLLVGPGIYCADYEVSLDGGPQDLNPGVMLYDNLGGQTDMGYDDDDENDRDIELDWRHTNAFNGQSVHQNWTVCVADTAQGDAGTVTELCLRIYWEIPEDGTCCGVKPGDRVVLLTDNPRSAFGLVAGTKGTVLCCDGDDPDLPIFVRWDNWSFGRNSDEHCDTPPLSYTPYSGWWVACQDIALAEGGGGRPGGGGGGLGSSGSSGPDLVFCLGGQCVSLGVDPSVPASSNTYIGSTTVEIEINFRAMFTATATATSAAGGTWTAWLDPAILGPGTVTTALWVRGENLNLAALPAGSEDIQVAQVQVYAAPAP